jgi:hypothetical protein
VILRPFSPIAGAGIINGTLAMRWVAGGGSASYMPFQTLGIDYGPPQPPYLQTTLYDDSRPLNGLGGSHSTTPPSGMGNGIIVGDSGMTDDGASSGSHGSAWWASAFASTCKVSFWPRVMPTGSDALWLYARLADPGTSSVTGYALKVLPPHTFELYRIDAGTLTLLDSFAILTSFDVGDGFQLQCNGSTITARYHDRDVLTPCYGDLFYDVLAATDSTYRSTESPSNVGYVGMGLDGTTARVFDFSGGSFFDPMPGLRVYLETNSCGTLTKTYTQLAAAINGAGLGFAATTLGGHGADVADRDNDLFLGADCSGGVRRKSAVPR